MRALLATLVLVTTWVPASCMQARNAAHANRYYMSGSTSHKENDNKVPITSLEYSLEGPRAKWAVQPRMIRHRTYSPTSCEQSDDKVDITSPKYFEGMVTSPLDARADEDLDNVTREVLC